MRDRMLVAYAVAALFLSLSFSAATIAKPDCVLIEKISPNDPTGRSGCSTLFSFWVMNNCPGPVTLDGTGGSQGPLFDRQTLAPKFGAQSSCERERDLDNTRITVAEVGGASANKKSEQPGKRAPEKVTVYAYCKGFKYAGQVSQVSISELFPIQLPAADAGTTLQYTNTGKALIKSWADFVGCNTPRRGDCECSNDDRSGSGRQLVLKAGFFVSDGPGPNRKLQPRIVDFPRDRIQLIESQN